MKVLDTFFFYETIHSYETYALALYMCVYHNTLWKVILFHMIYCGKVKYGKVVMFMSISTPAHIFMYKMYNILTPIFST